MSKSTPNQPDLDSLREAIVSGDPVRAMSALTQLRFYGDEAAVPLLVLGTKQTLFLVRSLSCSGLGYKRTEQGWKVLSHLLSSDGDPNVRAEAANALASYGVERSWPLLKATFVEDQTWLVRCSILSALAEQPDINLTWLLELAQLAVNDKDGTVRVSGAEILGRVIRDGADQPVAAQARSLLHPLQQDTDHRVVAAALNGLQTT
ncbi:HEAT repeat domain-containing protein [Synechococcus sp. M16CYN]|uniref:HEAT repeat domain-containing protein n=1 Tax=Synechococcus sp. M16CYN TaxID=3103139 RepID=UPI00324BF4C2